MTESELMSAASQAVQLGYLPGQWWVTMTTAFVVGIFFAGKLIPRWLFVLIVALYVLTVISILIESLVFGEMASDYMATLQAMRHARNASVGMPNPTLGMLDAIVTYLVFTGGSIGAIAYCTAIWRKERKDDAAASASGLK